MAYNVLTNKIERWKLFTNSSGLDSSGNLFYMMFQIGLKPVSWDWEGCHKIYILSCVHDVFIAL